jgi:hypothetical protein
MTSAVVLLSTLIFGVSCEKSAAPGTLPGTTSTTSNTSLVFQPLTPTIEMLVGAASQNASGSDWPALDTVAGPWSVRRSYDGGAVPATWSASVAGVDVSHRASVWSAKPDLTQLASGALDSSINAFLASIPSTHVAFLTVWHEPDGKIRKGQFTLAQWKPAFQHFCNLVHASGKPHVYTTLICEAWSGQSPSAGTTYADMWPGSGYVDVFGVDGYSNTGSDSALWNPAVTFAQSKSVPWGIGEVGCATTIDTAWMRKQAVYAATHSSGGHSSAAYFCWFSNDNGVIPTPGTNPAADATSHSISQQYFINYTTFSL